MSTWNSLALRAGLITLGIMVTGCAAVSPVSSSTSIEGRAADAVALRVVKPFTFWPALYSATFPAGVYFPAFEDSNGVYYRAPAQILKATIAGGGVIDGGLYVARTSWKSYRAYLTDGSIFKFDINVPVELEVITKP